MMLWPPWWPLISLAVTKVAIDQFGSDHLAALRWLTWSSIFFFLLFCRNICIFCFSENFSKLYWIILWTSCTTPFPNVAPTKLNLNLLLLLFLPFPKFFLIPKTLPQTLPNQSLKIHLRVFYFLFLFFKYCGFAKMFWIILQFWTKCCFMCILFS